MVSPVPVSGLARVGQVNPPARVKPFLRSSSECAIHRVVQLRDLSRCTSWSEISDLLEFTPRYASHTAINHAVNYAMNRAL